MKRFTTLAIAATLLASCAGPRPQAPWSAAFTPPAGWRDARDLGPAPDAAWWTGFHDPALDAIVEQALRNNVDIAIAASRVEEARAQFRLAGAQRLPDLSLGVGGGYQRDVNAFGIGTDQRVDSAQATLSWDADLFGRLAKASDAARASLLATEAARDGVRLAVAGGLSIMLTHSHPGGLLEFSSLDDASDRTSISSLFEAYGRVHGSAIMVPDGTMRARLYDPEMSVRSVDLVAVAGDDLSFQWSDRRRGSAAFTSAMTADLGRLTAVVIGVSGTGSIIAEQAARLGFGRVILIDFDKIENRNLNRILNSTSADAAAELLKVIAFSNAVSEYRGAGVAIPVPASIDTRDAVIAAAQGDVLFSCVDTLHARQMADLMAVAFVMPLFDMGVTIPARTDDAGAVSIIDAVGRIDYVQPGGSSLKTRGVYSPASVRAEYLAAADPEAHAVELAAGYFDGAIEEAPSVISLNMRAASAAMNEFILRAFPFRLDPNSGYARTKFSLAGGDEDRFAEGDFPAGSHRLLGRGGLEPLLGMPGLGAMQ